MNTGLESELRAAFTERARDVPVQAAERMRRIDYKPRAYSLGPHSRGSRGARARPLRGSRGADLGQAWRPHNLSLIHI